MPVREVSAAFREAFAGGGGGQLKCVCGRTHFSEPSRWDWDPGEYDKLQWYATAKPNQFVFHEGCGCVEVSSFGYVWGCECNEGARLETFILEQGALITRFLHNGAKKEVATLVQRMYQAATAAEALEAEGFIKSVEKERAATAYKALTGDKATPWR